MYELVLSFDNFAITLILPTRLQIILLVALAVWSTGNSDARDFNFDGHVCVWRVTQIFSPLRAFEHSHKRWLLGYLYTVDCL